MIKPLSIVATTLIGSLAASAQSANPFEQNSPVGRAAEKTTGVESRLVGDTHRSFDVNSGKLILTDSSYNIYNSNNNRCDINVRRTLDNYGMNNSSRYTNTYDARHRLATQTYESWIFNQNKWEVNGRTVFSYNSQDKLTVEEHQALDGGNWDTQFKESYTYNTQGDLIERRTQTRDAGGPLVSSFKVVNTYSVTGARYDTSYYWNASAWKVGGFGQQVSSGNKLTKIIAYRTNPSTNLVDRIDSTVFEYDSKGNLAETRSGHFQNGIWDQSKTLSTYDANGNHINWILQSFENGAFVNLRQASMTYNNYGQMLTHTFKHWDANASQWVFTYADGVENFYYEQFTNGILDEAVRDSELQVYPNPANDMLSLKLEGRVMSNAMVILSDMTGKVIKQWLVSAQPLQTLDVSGVASGTYLLKVTDAQTQLSRQVRIIR